MDNRIFAFSTGIINQQSIPLYKLVLTLYCVCFFCYIVFTRQPDYFDSEFSPATIHYVNDSATGKPVAKAFFSVGKDKYIVDATYPLTSLKEGEKVSAIYELSQPEKGAVYRFWGYWMTWGELLASIVMIFILFQIAVGITNNPTPEALDEDVNYKPEKKRKYKD
ncbi:hypothetical protein ACI6Q2_22645 [Chitinophagaceae bacterium LWZ2-11]